MQIDPLFSWQHVEIVGIVMVPFIVQWIDVRRQNERHHKETQDQNWKMHAENQSRLAEIETKLEPVWDWWTRLRNGGGIH